MGLPSISFPAWPEDILPIDLLFAPAFKLLVNIGFVPKSSAKLTASLSLISFDSLSSVFIPIIPWFNLTFTLYFNSLIIPGKSSEKVKLVAATMLLSESKAIPLLLRRSSLFLSIGLSSWIFKVKPKNISWKLPNASSGSATFWLSKYISSADWIKGPCLAASNLLKV